MRLGAGFAICVAVAALTDCQREQRNPRPVASQAAVMATQPQNGEFVPGGPVNPDQIATAARSGPTSSPYAGNAYAISQGQRLFDWFNCSGCHGGNGGGAIGPPLNDKKWKYGGSPDDIFESIVHGRKNGMPAWGARIPRDQVWQLVAYVRSIAGDQPKAASPARTDSIEPNPSEIQNKVRGETR